MPPTPTPGTPPSAGTLQLNNAQAVQNSTVNVNADNGLSFGTGIGTFTLGGLAGSGSFSLADTGGNAVALQVGNNNANTAYSGSLSGSGSLTKIGGGVLQLDGNNTFTGPTIVAAAHLSGTGTLDRHGHGQSLAHIAPGDNTSGNFGGIGTLTVGGLTLSSGAVLDMDLGGSSDLLAITGTLTLNGATINVRNSGGLTTGTYEIMSYGAPRRF